MEPGRRNWVPTTPALAPLWDVTVGEPWLFSRITEILAEIEQKWKCGWWIPCRATRAHYTHARTQEHTHTHTNVHPHTFLTPWCLCKWKVLLELSKSHSWVKFSLFLQHNNHTNSAQLWCIPLRHHTLWVMFAVCTVQKAWFVAAAVVVGGGVLFWFLLTPCFEM